MVKVSAELKRVRPLHPCQIAAQFKLVLGDAGIGEIGVWPKLQLAQATVNRIADFVNRDAGQLLAAE